MAAALGESLTRRRPCSNRNRGAIPWMSPGRVVVRRTGAGLVAVPRLLFSQPSHFIDVAEQVERFLAQGRVAVVERAVAGETAAPSRMANSVSFVSCGFDVPETVLGAGSVAVAPDVFRGEST